MSEAAEAPVASDEVEDTPRKERWWLPLLLIALTFASTLYVGFDMIERPAGASWQWWDGWTFAVPLMAILLAHEFGHFIAGRIHGVDVSPPFFIPMPIPPLGTMGAVIRMRRPIGTRNALFDVGAAGPLAGLAVALPVLIYGLSISDVRPLPETGYIMEGRSLLYYGLLFATHGAIPAGQDVFLSPTAFAGWAGLLVTMINLLPVGQLDGGHVAYALIGPDQDRVSLWIRRLLPLLAVIVSAAYAVPAYLSGLRGERLLFEVLAGVHWLVWAGILWVIARVSGPKHPPTGPAPLSPRRRILAAATLVLFVLLFMPSWIRQQ